ncbi:aromatic ring-hydroxylating oxygenase subunit alpha [Catelliglobosispora koreensis]|uniref:aromatic ring-hydroxylating oxygenase subunit alpha n=1 Tax=Catelliglobosispora koreensis TaxID=129052 RepID=UPI000365F460|nr:aromatic ring-hydroxylating dioxygenase subunit alpha [Catelliglobosispora koreensis]
MLETAPASALAAKYYLDPAIAELERTEIFSRSWQLVAHESDLPRAGARIVAPIAGREVLVVRAEDGSLKGHLNVCRHRGSRLVIDAQPDGKAIRCPYHGWTYKLDGSLVGAPEGRLIPCLDKPKLGLYPVRVESFLGFIFANLDEHATPLHEQVPGLAELAGRYLGPDLVPVGKDRIYHTAGETQKANWKVVVDNYLEGYHVPVAHPGLMRLLDYQRYSAEIHDSYVFFEAPMRPEPSGNRLERLYQWVTSPMPGLSEADSRVWRYAVIYPNTLIDLYPDHVLAWSVTPQGVAQSGLPGAFYTKPGASRRTKLAQHLNIKIGWITNDEDAELVARVQQGMSTPGWSPGPLSRREAAVGWFADRIRKDVGQ